MPAIGSVPVRDITQRSRIVVADDDEAIRKMLRVLLELDGHEVLEAPDGDAAWKLVTTLHPAVVIADVQMPGTDGLELCRKIKAKGRGRTKVIVYTASMATLDEAREAGSDAFFFKSEPLARLRTAVRELCALPIAV